MLEEEIFARSHAASQSSSKLVFISPPNKDTSFVLPDPESLTSANCGQFALKTTAPANREFLEHEAWFCGAVIQLRLMPRGDGDEASILEDYALDALTSLNQHKKSQWIQQIGNRFFVVPIRKQLFQDLKQWFGRILAVPGMEEAMENHLRSSHDDGILRDIRDSPVFKEIPGPDGKPFMQLDENSHDLPVMFSLGYDAFHPFHFSNEKSHISSTAIYMVNLCLPEHLRY
ncbi:hypothetical protein EV368DRAFT_53612, partial [Lentinula lateritia]